MTQSKTLSNFSQTIDMYLDEADWCANHTYKSDTDAVLGLAAMTLSLACVVSVGEALFREIKGPNDISIKSSIAAFCNEMNNNDWFLSPEGKPSKQKLAETLTNIRNALIHGLSLPNGVCLVPKAEDYYDHHSINYEIGIEPRRFVAEVKKTINELIRRRPSLPFDDLLKEKSRAPVKIDMTASVSSR